MKMENDLGKDPVPSLVLRIALPSMLAQFVSVLYSIVDRMYIGNIPEIGKLALAGAGVCGPIVTMVGAFAFLVGIGGSPLMSIRMGGGDNEAAKKILANCFLLLAGLSVVLMGVTLATREQALMLFGASEATLPFALRYYTIYLFGTPLALLSTGMNQFIICQGYAKKGMFSVLLGAVLNIILDPIFIFVFDMGVGGAALATVISQAASCIYVLRFLLGPIPPIRISFGGYDLHTMGRILALGFTPFAIIVMDNLMVIGLNALLQRYGGLGRGDLLVAAATISQSFMMVVGMPMGGITGGTGSILGYNYGAGQPHRILQAQKWILGLCLGYTTILTIAGQFFPAPFVSIFTNEAGVAELAITAIRICSLGLIPLAVQYVVVDGFTGMGMMRYSLPLSFFRKLVYFIPLFILPAHFGAMSTFLAEPISDFIAPIVCTVVYWMRIRYVVGIKPRKTTR